MSAISRPTVHVSLLNLILEMLWGEGTEYKCAWRAVRGTRTTIGSITETCVLLDHCQHCRNEKD
jgi:hypothetical protein